MRRTYALVAIALLLVVTGILIGFGSSDLFRSKASMAAQSEPRPEWAKLTDDEYVPIPEDAKVIGATEESHLFRRLIYETALEESEVERFHDTHLLPLGWARPVADAANSIGLDYTWTDPTGAIPWHLELAVSVSPWVPSGSIVTLIFTRYPDPERTLTAYPGSETATRESATQPGDPSLGSYIDEIITSTFSTDHSPAEVADFYNGTLPNHGWVFFDGKRGVVSEQPGKIEDPPGIFFRGIGPGRQGSEGTTYWLYVTAQVDDAGRTTVEQRMTIKPHTFPHLRR